MLFTSCFFCLTISIWISDQASVNGSHWDYLKQMWILFIKFLSSYSRFRFHLPLFNSQNYLQGCMLPSWPLILEQYESISTWLNFQCLKLDITKANSSKGSNFFSGYLCADQYYYRCNLVEFQFLITSHSFTASKRMLGETSENNPEPWSKKNYIHTPRMT